MLLTLIWEEPGNEKNIYKSHTVRSVHFDVRANQ
jgi:hypothetical protein